MRRPKVAKASDRLKAVVGSGIGVLFVFTFIVDLLLLVQPVYMLQVYDRVLTSGSLDTLLFISLMAVGGLILLGIVDMVRGMISGRISARMDVEAGSDALLASLDGPRASIGDVQPIRDLGVVRNFIANRGILAYLDLPFAPLFIGILYFIHPHLFWLTVGGATILTLLAVLNQMISSRTSEDGMDSGIGASLSAQAFARGAESINAMGMASNIVSAWGRSEAAALRAQDRAQSVNAKFSGLSRAVRLGLQIAILGYGGYLVLEGQMTAGMIFASSLISGRGLQPIDQVIGGWKGFIEARKSWQRLKDALDRRRPAIQATELPTPAGHLSIDQVVVFGSNAIAAEPLLKRVSAEIVAGECVAVIGPSGAGKSTLARTIVGAMVPRSGMVRIDGADCRGWDRERLGRHIGYLSQEVELFPGTVAENIARFDADADDADIVAAAQRAQVHDMILALPKGYDTIIGPAGHMLSGGQRQRVGLARAFFGGPKLLVLDEPNASLDADGDIALEKAIDWAKMQKMTVVIVTQRRQIADRADKILILRDGLVEDFGPRRAVAERQNAKAKQARPADKSAVAVVPPAAVAQARTAQPAPDPFDAVAKSVAAFGAAGNPRPAAEVVEGRFTREARGEPSETVPSSTGEGAVPAQAPGTVATLPRAMPAE